MVRLVALDLVLRLVLAGRTRRLNPVRARMVSRAVDWPWSSCAATAGLVPVRSCLTVATLLDRFDPFDRDHERSEALARLPEIGAAHGIGTTGVSYLIGRAEGEVWKNERFATMVDEARLAIRNCRLQV